MSDCPCQHVLSFDVEEYFHVESAAAGGLTHHHWPSMPQALEEPIDHILALLAEHKAQATFFILGWVAQHEPHIVHKIAAAGHEIASHGMSHSMLHRIKPEEFRGELRDSRKLLQDLSGQEVVGFRAATFSITRRTAWALDVLAEEGLLYDSSIFPIRHDRYGVPGAPCWVHHARGPAGGKILELPPLTARLAGMTLPLGGGGYLRLLPAGMVAAGLRRAQRQGRCGMIYLHPWEFDPDHPELPMSRLSRWRHRHNLHRTSQKLHRLLDEFTFITARAAAQAAGGCECEIYAYAD